ncbi:Response regulator containing a CheY-like receiver domain and an HTH DNA-binding domain [Myroides sp. A21]|uniref:response regulator transcription factor n=1 Tax=Myroides sp. A21 TaxID=1583100 RepID=UPI00057D8D43|nr:response regulator transcription factor [Myroides sp. A21]AJA67383.1 Response regulator containing a CheY-like receiver domain and an HTH DNA-binding domain [Myroides sp. A21]
MVRIGIVDDHTLFRESFELLVNQFENSKVVSQCSNGLELLKELEEKEIDLIFLDLQMPVMDGFQTASLVLARFPKIKIIVLTSFSDLYNIERMLQLNISGYLTKSIQPSLLEKAIRIVSEGGVFYDGNIKQIIHIFQQHVYKSEVVLTDKEIVIIKLFALQHSGKEIAEKLNLSLRTIEKYKENLIYKTSASNFIGVIIYAMQRHYISLSELYR